MKLELNRLEPADLAGTGKLKRPGTGKLQRPRF
jgi:hypothetical protein